MRLIDVDLLKESIEKDTCPVNISYFYRKMRDAKTVDAVPAIRCKDCKYWDDEEYAKGNLHVCNCPDKDWATTDTRNNSFVTLYKPEDFCSYGERKEE